MSRVEHDPSGVGTCELDGFEVWDRTIHAPAGHAKKTAFVSLRVGGVIGMNRAARAMLGPVEACKVMYDPKRQRLGFVPTDPEDPNSYDISCWDNTQLACKKMLDYYGIKVTECRRYYDLQVVDGILVVDIGPDADSWVPRQAGRWR